MSRGGSFGTCIRQMNSLGETCSGDWMGKENFVLVNFLTCNFVKMKSSENILSHFSKSSQEKMFSRTPQDRTQILLISAAFK